MKLSQKAVTVINKNSEKYLLFFYCVILFKYHLKVKKQMFLYAGNMTC